MVTMVPRLFASGLMFAVLAIAVRDESGVPSGHDSSGSHGDGGNIASVSYSDRMSHSTGHISHINHSTSSSSYVRRTKHIMSTGSRRVVSSNSICEERVHNTLADLPKDTPVGARIGAVLADPSKPKTFQACCKSTEYDNFMRTYAQQTFGSTSYERIVRMDVKSRARANQKSSVFDKETALVIIDVQRDFTEGSFAQPCWNSIHRRFMQDMNFAIRKAAAAGSLIVASKDFHPSEHCSFQGPGSCMNRKDAHEKTSNARYQNNFPSHCTFSIDDKSGYLRPQPAPETPFCEHMKKVGAKVPFCSDASFYGTHFEPSLAETLASLSKDVTVEVVYKGLSKDFDSFSAMHHEVTTETSHHASEAEIEAERRATGGFALPEKQARECRGKWDETKECYPTEKQLKEKDSKLRSFSSILNKHKIKKMVVVGLVYDYCVKETAIFTRENTKYSMPVTVLGHLTRPSFDGKPGSPYTPGLCDGEAEEDGFCTEGGGTTQAHKKVLADYTSNGVLFEQPLRV